MRTTAFAMKAILWLGGIALVAPVHVVDADVYCNGGSANFRFNPGVTFKKGTAQITGNGDLRVCNSPENSQIAGGQWRFEGSGTGACAGPLVVGYGRLHITWNDGSASIIPQASFRAEAALTFSFEGGGVTEGPFKGGAARAQGKISMSNTEMAAQCVTSGVTGFSGTIDLFGIETN